MPSPDPLTPRTIAGKALAANVAKLIREQPMTIIEREDRCNEMAAIIEQQARLGGGLRGLYEHLFGAATLVIENNYAPDPSLRYDVARWSELVASVNALRAALAGA